MMAATTVRDEPSMEEILASIRKIISEQDPEPAPAKPTLQSVPPAPSAPDTGAEVLELTTVLNEDGTITDLASMGEDTLVDDFDSLVAEAIEQHDFQQPDVTAALEDVAADLADFSDPAMAFATEASDFGDMTPEDLDSNDMLGEMPEMEHVLSATESAADAALSPVSASPVSAASGSFAEAVTPAVTHAAEAALLSSHAVDRSLSALSELRSAMQATVAQPAGPSVTLEDLTRELLRPMLKTWLDANLPPLVERIVKEEVRRITSAML